MKYNARIDAGIYRIMFEDGYITKESGLQINDISACEEFNNFILRLVATRLKECVLYPVPFDGVTFAQIGGVGLVTQSGVDSVQTTFG